MVPVLDHWQRTGLNNVYVVSDGSGLLGSEGALCEGRIAAIGIAEKLGELTAREAKIKADHVRRNYKRNRSDPLPQIGGSQGGSQVHHDGKSVGYVSSAQRHNRITPFHTGEV